MTFLRSFPSTLSSFQSSILKKQIPLFQVPVRWSRYKDSPPYTNNPEDYTEFEVSKDPKEWAWVENCLPLKTVPIPTATGKTPSGWFPPKEEAKKLPYYVQRTKNHMLPVYLNFSHKRDMCRTTLITKIQGDIWQLESDLRNFCETHETCIFRKRIGSSINELGMNITFRGDFVNRVKQFLERKGF